MKLSTYDKHALEQASPKQTKQMLVDRVAFKALCDERDQYMVAFRRAARALALAEAEFKKGRELGARMEVVQALEQIKKRGTR